MEKETEEEHIANDGKTHINIYTKGLTLLGRQLSNLADTPFVHPEFGKFRTVEGFWYWLSTGKKENSILRELSGFSAKAVGRQLPKVKIADFEKQIKIAIKAKVRAHPDILKLLVESDLPFEHYYYYNFGGKGAKIIKPKNLEWLVDCICDIRDELCLEDTVKKDFPGIVQIIHGVI